MEGFGKKAVAWGALTHARGDLPVKSDEVLLDIWYNGYADPFEMAELGFGLVNVACSQLYIIPLTALYYHDYLNIEWIFNNWEPYMFDDRIFSRNDRRVKGECLPYGMITLEMGLLSRTFIIVRILLCRH